MGADAARGEIHDLGHRLLDRGLGHLAGAEGVGVDRERPRHANGVGKLEDAALGEAGGDDVLGEVAGGVGGGAVDLGRVLAGEGAAAVRGRAAVGVDDDLAAGEAGVAVRTADDELAGRVDVPDGGGGQPALGQHLADVGLDHLADVGGLHRLVEMLGREHEAGDLDRLAAGVAERELRLRVGAEAGLGAALARLGEAAEDGVGIVDRRRHQLEGLVGRVAEHDPLVARALLLAVAAVNALGDVLGLAVDVVVDAQVGPVEALLLVADVLDAVADDVLDPLQDVAGAAHLAADDHPVGGGEGLAGDARLGVLVEEGVEHRVGDPVAHLVGMAFRHRLGGEEVIAATAHLDDPHRLTIAFPTQGRGQGQPATASAPAGRTVRGPGGERAHQRQHGGAGVVVADRGEGVVQGRDLVVAHAAVRGGLFALAGQPLVELAGLNAEVGGDLVEPPGPDPVRPLLVLLDLREGQAEVAAEPPLADAERLAAAAHPAAHVDIDLAC
jgi:hypothetical protein